MKKLFAIFLVMLLAVACWSIDIFRGTEATPTWDAVTTMADGTPVAPTDTVAYEVYMSPVPDPQNPSVEFPQDAAQHTFLGGTNQLELLISIPQDGQVYAIAVRTVLTDENANVFYSVLNWSYENGEWTPNPFLYQGSQNPKAPKTLQRD